MTRKIGPDEIWHDNLRALPGSTLEERDDVGYKPLKEGDLGPVAVGLCESGTTTLKEIKIVSPSPETTKSNWGENIIYITMDNAKYLVAEGKNGEFFAMVRCTGDIGNDTGNLLEKAQAILLDQPDQLEFPLKKVA